MQENAKVLPANAKAILYILCFSPIVFSHHHVPCIAVCKLTIFIFPFVVANDAEIINCTFKLAVSVEKECFLWTNLLYLILNMYFSSGKHT